MKMTRSNNIEKFEYCYKEAKNILKRRHPRNIVDEHTLDSFASERKSYSRYLLRQIKGSIDRVGSSPSEQNHSSVLYFLLMGSKERINTVQILIFLFRFNQQIRNAYK